MTRRVPAFRRLVNKCLMNKQMNTLIQCYQGYVFLRHFLHPLGGSPFEDEMLLCGDRKKVIQTQMCL